MIFTLKDAENYSDKKSITIPEGVKEIRCNFKDGSLGYGAIESISIPESVKTIPKKCFEGCKFVTTIDVPLNETRVVYGKKIFNNQPHFDQSFYISGLVRIVNGKKIGRAHV